MAEVQNFRERAQGSRPGVRNSQAGVRSFPTSWNRPFFNSISSPNKFEKEKNVPARTEFLTGSDQNDIWEGKNRRDLAQDSQKGLLKAASRKANLLRGNLRFFWIIVCHTTRSEPQRRACFAAYDPYRLLPPHWGGQHTIARQIRRQTRAHPRGLERKLRNNCVGLAD